MRHKRAAYGRRQTNEHSPHDDYTPDEIEFMKAMRKYMDDNNRKFPLWSEVLEVLKSLGYQKITSQENRDG